MAEAIGHFLLEVFGNEYLATLFVSMFPLIELKGAIPIGTGLFGISLPKTALVAYLGSTVIFVAEFFLLLPVFALLKKIPLFRRLVAKAEGLFARKAKGIAKKTEGSAEREAKRIMMWSLFLFVAVPFPVTGIWTGTAVAVFLGLRFRDSILPIALGNLVAGGIITALTWLFYDYVDLIIYILFAVALVMLAVFCVKIAVSRPEKTEKKEE